jgi:hypothetical protein
VVAGAIALVAAKWFTVQPSSTRDWQPEVAETPHADIEGDRVVIHRFRGFEFFTKHWGSNLVCHTLLSFDW